MAHDHYGEGSSPSKSTSQLAMKMYTTTQHALCAAIRSYLNMSAGAEEAKLFKFSDGEALIQLAAAPAPAETTVVIQAVSAPVNDSLVHTVFLLEALRLACASSVVLVITYLGYSRQDRPTRQLSLTAAGVVCKMLSAANVSRAYVVEAHSAAATALLAPPSFNLPITALVCEHISRR